MTLLPLARRRRIVAAAGAIALSLLAGAAAAQANGRAAEHQVKAAFLYKFVGFVDWPASAFGAADSPLQIGVLGAAPLADELSGLVAGRSVGDRPLAVRRLRRGDALPELHMLFVGRDELGGGELLAAARGRPLLTVTESESNFPAGAMINFVVVDDRVRFDIALKPAEAANLRISARLLTVARKVLQ